MAREVIGKDSAQLRNLKDKRIVRENSLSEEVLSRNIMISNHIFKLTIRTFYLNLILSQLIIAD